MAQITVENLKFRYSLSDRDSLDGINLTVGEGEYIVLCGKSGCGKTTLLRHLKPALTPKGERSGTVYLNGSDLYKADLRTQSEKIGFVMQNPDSQIVTDKVWHELAFGLENLGLKTAEIRLRVAEMASYFDIEDQFDRKVNELSGGQKQLLNLASVMAMHPDILILDEPTSQLDPIAADRFLATVNRINKDLGVTVIITEHRLEEVFTCADRIVVMDSGRIVADGTPEEIGRNAENLPHFVRLSLPTAMRIFSAVGGEGECPVCVRDGRKWLSRQKIYNKKIDSTEPKLSSDNAIE
ncbi:MAG TPA: cobalt ABC transporter ATP-binding protein, partial [Ruminococcaceae bacterium]|nr:cobalt ABC transporter ATP-binding protein [Oscillospiraceae bacterium]